MTGFTEIATKKRNPECVSDRSLSASGSRSNLCRAALRDTCVSGTTVGLDAGLATNRNDRSTPRDSRLALDSFPASGCRAARDDCCGRSALCREHSAETALQVTGLAGHPPRLRVEESLLPDCENFGNSSRNECVSTPPISKVNKIIATISRLFSTECSSSTGPCLNFVQCENQVFNRLQFHTLFSRL